MGGRAIMPDVVTYLSARAGEPVALAQLAAGINVEPNRVQKALSNAISQGVYGPALECVHRGQVWVWRGEGHAAPAAVSPAWTPPAPTPIAAPPVATVAPKALQKGDMVEILGAMQDGNMVASDENGRLYRVVPL